MKKRLLCLGLLLCLCAGMLLSACGAKGTGRTSAEEPSADLPADRQAALRPSGLTSPQPLSASFTFQDPYYGSGSLPEVTTPVYWPKNSPNYNTRINLISGKTPLVQSATTITGDVATEYFNSLETLPQLTDGKYAVNATYSDPALVHFTRGRNRSLYFDLGYTSAVSGAKFSFLQEDSTAVNLPEAIYIALSDDGIGWQTVYQSRDLSVPRTDTFCRTEVNFDKVYAARFVRITFNVSIHVFCDEIQVYGTKAIPSNAAAVVPLEEEAPGVRGYIMPEDFLGVHNVMLSYNCLGLGGAHPESGLITQAEYRPYVGYYDTDGNLVDTFFDGFLFLPYTAFNYDNYARTLDGWNYYLDDVFYANRNMDALNKEVGRVAEELSLEDYRVTVFTSVLYPWTTLSNGATNTFGDLDGDGKNDSFSSLENRKKAVKWMMDQEYNRFLAGEYQNLTFGGFYWFEESLSFYNKQELELVRYAADYAHSLGVKLFWIPYYCAAGFDRWEDFGLDLACMQPNYMFGNRNVPEVLEITANLTKELGMCVEIEISDVNDPGDLSRYREYLEAGAEYGYMYAVKMYYQNGVPGAFYYSWASADPKKRAVYDMTYLYAKERFGDASIFTPGDVNGDGKVTDADVTLLMEALSGMRTLIGTPFRAADLNNNGILDARDLTLLLQKIG
ncbi:MAG: DUF4855 domain-containing protein [Oscillospiraceae bacterium]|nr:DUF4855 domain-containing protein [Oscillospiraceae bacterium]